MRMTFQLHRYKREKTEKNTSFILYGIINNCLDILEFEVVKHYVSFHLICVVVRNKSHTAILVIDDFTETKYLNLAAPKVDPK